MIVGLSSVHLGKQADKIIINEIHPTVWETAIVRAQKAGEKSPKYNHFAGNQNVSICGK